MNFNEIDPSTYDKYTFGKCIRQQRAEQGLRLKDVASVMKCSEVFISDIELGRKFAPEKIEKLMCLAKVLNVRSEDISSFIDMAGASRGHYEYVKEYVQENKNVREFIRKARELNLSNDEWQDVISYLKDIECNRHLR